MRPESPVTVRDAGSEDSELFLQVIRASILGIAAKYYPAEVIESWAPSVDEAALHRTRANLDGEHRIISEMGGRAVGIGSVVFAKCELRACYVVPGAVRTGVGTTIVRRLEDLARQHGLRFLQFDASISAEQFYNSLGYVSLRRDQHILSSGMAMACVKMRKDF